MRLGLRPQALRLINGIAMNEQQKATIDQPVWRQASMPGDKIQGLCWLVTTITITTRPMASLMMAIREEPSKHSIRWPRLD